MTKSELFNIYIEHIDDRIYKETKRNWDNLSKPLDGMGDFEEIVCRIAAIQKNVIPRITDRVLVVFCSDNGIVSRGVTQSEQEITKKVAISLGSDCSSACCLARNVNTKVVPIDVGINCDEHIKGVINRKISKGTNDFLYEPAMSEKQVLQAIDTGIEFVKLQKKNGVELIATGEMGIGNTTTSAAVLAGLTGIDSDEIVGRGAGLNDEKLLRKKSIVKVGLEKYIEEFNLVTEKKEKTFEILRCLGGLDIAAMSGVFIGGALYGVPVLIDGFISAVAALCADRMVEGTKEYMIASHSGRERGTEVALREMNLCPLINGNMALGEGTGALMLIPLLDNALYMYLNCTRFNEMGIENYERFN